MKQARLLRNANAEALIQTRRRIALPKIYANAYFSALQNLARTKASRNEKPIVIIF
jgi:hypothetical protein